MMDNGEKLTWTVTELGIFSIAMLWMTSLWQLFIPTALICTATLWLQAWKT